MSEKRIIQTILKNISSTETYAVRHPVLRQGKPIETCSFEGDLHPKSFHLGVYANNRLVGVASYLKNNHADFSGEQYQLRGMAVLPEFQQNGFGEMLFKAGENQLREKKADLLWFNAREIAKNFYLKQNCKVIGQPYEIKGVGMHFLMVKEIVPSLNSNGIK